MSLAVRVRRFVEPNAPCAAYAPSMTSVAYALATLALAAWTIQAVRARTGGEPAVPLDDAYIHFAYARSFATLHPLSFTAGAPPTAGATSLLWALALAPLWLLGLRDTALVWGAWLLAYAALFGLAVETRRLAEGLVSPWLARFAGALVLAFGGFAWSAGSGMEIVPFAWLLVRAARLAAELSEGRLPERDDADAPDAPDARAPAALVRDLAITGALAPLARPEGVVVAILAAVVLVRAGRAGRAGRAARVSRDPSSRARLVALAPLAPLAPLAGIALGPLIFLALTGHAIAATAEAKWLLYSPYHHGRAFLDAVSANLAALVGPILGAEFPSAHVLPPGGRILAPLSLVALAIAAKRTGKRTRAIAVLVVAAAVLLPTTYETFLANRLRYVWPFVAGWLVLLATLLDVVGERLERWHEGLGRVRLALAAFVLLVFAAELPKAIEDLAADAAAVRDQHVAAARWVAANLPATSVVGVNDAGAMAYLSGRATYDVVGLTTRDEARYWVAGPGSRFEHWEHLPREALPTHFAVYPEWLQVPPALGPELKHWTVEGAPILGAPALVVAEARWSALGSGEAPSDAPSDAPSHASASAHVVDALDVSDLESEAAHGYELGEARRMANVLFGFEGRVDGGRLERTRDRFHLRLARGGRLLARIGATLPYAVVHVRVDGAELGALELGGVWQEVALAVGDRDGDRAIEVEALPGRPFLAMHYWSLAP
jgi:hypothetical protein